MTNFTKFLSLSLFIVTFAFKIVLAMETEYKKFCRHTVLPIVVIQRLDEAKTSHKLNLEHIYGSDYEFRPFDGQCESIAQKIKQLQSLQSISFGALLHKMSRTGLALIAESVTTLPELRYLNLENTYLDYLDETELQLITQMLQNAPHPYSINFTQCNLYQLSPTELTSLFSPIAKKQIAQLNLSNNNLYNLSGIKLAALTNQLKLARTITNLNLEKNFLYMLEAPAWRLWGPAIHNLKQLNIRGNQFGDRRLISEIPLMSLESWQALTKELILSDIEELDLSCNELNRIDNICIWQALANAISQMKKLKQIDMRNNKLGLIEKEFFTIITDNLMRNPNKPTIIITEHDDPLKNFQNLYDQKKINLVLHKAKTYKPPVISAPTDVFFDSTFER